MNMEYRAKIYLDTIVEGKGKTVIDGKGGSNKQTIDLAGSDGISVMPASDTPFPNTSNGSNSDINQITPSFGDPRVKVSVTLTRTPLARAVRSMTVPVTLSRPLTPQALAAARHTVIKTVLTTSRLIKTVLTTSRLIKTLLTTARLKSKQQASRTVNKLETQQGNSQHAVSNWKNLSFQNLLET